MLKINFKQIFQSLPLRCLLLPLVLIGVVACSRVDVSSQAPEGWHGVVTMTREVTGVGKYVYLTEDVIFIQKVNPEEVDLFGGTEYEIMSGEMTMTVDLNYECTRKGQTKYALAKNEGTLTTNRNGKAKNFYDGDISLTHAVMVTTHCPGFPDLTMPEDTNDFIIIDSSAADDNTPSPDGHLKGVFERIDGNNKITVAWDLTPMN